MARKTRLASLPDGTPFHCINRMEMLFCYKEIFESRAYENPLIKINNGDVILDVGANIGLFLYYISRRCTHSTLFAFEPIPRTYKALVQNAQSLRGHDVRLITCGLSDRTGEAEFTFLRNVTVRSTMYPEFSPGNPSQQSQTREVELMLQIFDQLPKGVVRTAIGSLPNSLRRGLAKAAVKFHARKRHIICPLKTLSQVIDENGIDRIDLLKIDVEGAERDVLRGIRDEHWRLIRQMILEVHEGEGGVLNDVRNKLEEQGLRTVVTPDALPPASIVFAARG